MVVPLGELTTFIFPFIQAVASQFTVYLKGAMTLKLLATRGTGKGSTGNTLRKILLQFGHYIKYERP